MTVFFLHGKAEDRSRSDENVNLVEGISKSPEILLSRLTSTVGTVPVSALCDTQCAWDPEEIVDIDKIVFREQ